MLGINFSFSFVNGCEVPGCSNLPCVDTHFCATHKCVGTNCIHRRIEGSRFCDKCPERCLAYPECNVRMKGNKACVKHKCRGSMNCRELAINNGKCDAHDICTVDNCDNKCVKDNMLCSLHLNLKCAKCKDVSVANKTFCKIHLCVFHRTSLGCSNTGFNEITKRESLYPDLSSDNKRRLKGLANEYFPTVCEQHLRMYTSDRNEYIRIMNSLNYNSFADYIAPVAVNIRPRLLETSVRDIMTSVDSLIASLGAQGVMELSDEELNRLLNNRGGSVSTSSTRNTTSNTSTSRNTSSTSINNALSIDSETKCPICLELLFSSPFKSYTCAVGSMHALHEECLKSLEEGNSGYIRGRKCKLCVSP